MTSEDVIAAARGVVDQLTTLQHALSGRPEAERRAAFEQALGEALGGLDPGLHDPVLAQCRDLILDRARDREERWKSSEAESARLRAELDALRHECEQLKAEVARMAAVTRVMDAGGTDFERLLVELKSLGKDAGRMDTSRLAPAESRILSTTEALLTFAFQLGTKLKEFEAGVSREGTVIVKEYGKRFRRHYAEALEGEEGALDKLREILGEMVWFIGRVDTAWSKAIPDAAKALLDELNWEGIKEKSKKFGGYDEKALVGAVDKTLGALLSMDLLDFFKERFTVRFLQERARPTA